MLMVPFWIVVKFIIVVYLLHQKQLLSVWQLWITPIDDVELLLFFINSSRRLHLERDWSLQKIIKQLLLRLKKKTEDHRNHFRAVSFDLCFVSHVTERAMKYILCAFIVWKMVTSKLNWYVWPLKEIDV